MKTGFENKRNLIILAVLAAVLIAAAVYFVRYMFGGSPSPAPAPATSSSSQGPSTPENAGPLAAATDANGHAAKKMPALEKLDPTLHPEVMAGAESLEYSGKGRNIFSMTSAPGRDPEGGRQCAAATGSSAASAWPSSSSAHRSEVLRLLGQQRREEGVSAARR